MMLLSDDHVVAAVLDGDDDDDGGDDVCGDDDLPHPPLPTSLSVEVEGSHGNLKCYLTRLTVIA